MQGRGLVEFLFENSLQPCKVISLQLIKINGKIKNKKKKKILFRAMWSMNLKGKKIGIRDILRYQGG